MQLTNTRLPGGFTYLHDICPQIVQHIKYATEDNFTGGIIEGYAAGNAILTTEATIS